MSDDQEREQRFPIQDGPNVPWEVMAPYESQAQTNHSQTLKRLAERGGLGCAEAWAVVNGLGLRAIMSDFAAAKASWIQFADGINRHYSELAALRAKVEEQAKALAEFVVQYADKCVELDAARQENQRLVTANENWHLRMGQLINERDHLLAIRDELEQENQARFVAGLATSKEDVLAEPEYPGDMPHEMWNEINVAVYCEDRNAVAEAFRATVRLTKENIVKRIDARIAEENKEGG